MYIDASAPRLNRTSYTGNTQSLGIQPASACADGVREVPGRSVVAQHRAPISQGVSTARTSREPPALAQPPRRRLEQNTAATAFVQCTIAQPNRDLDVLLADAPGGKLPVSRDSYHRLAPNAQRAFKRGDARIVVAEDEGCHSSGNKVADSLLALQRTQTPFRDAASASTS